MTTPTKTTIYRDNHNDDNKRKSGKVTIVSIIAVVGLLAAKYFFCGFGPGKYDNFIQAVHNSLSAMPFNTIITKMTNKGKVLEFEIEVGLRDDMRRSIRDRIIHNLEATKQFLELGEDYKDICAGLYTYAVEEYGKILFLSGLSPILPNNKIPVQYTDGKQGFLNHRHKIDLALNALPYSCKLISQGSFSSGHIMLHPCVISLYNFV